MARCWNVTMPVEFFAPNFSWVWLSGICGKIVDLSKIKMKTKCMKSIVLYDGFALHSFFLIFFFYLRFWSCYFALFFHAACLRFQMCLYFSFPSILYHLIIVSFCYGLISLVPAKGFSPASSSLAPPFTSPNLT